jgi:pantoate--beta-alanine ligase
MSGALHEGHLSVIREARRRADRVLAAVFIDPMTVEEGVDAGDYSPDEAEAAVTLEAEGCDAVYAPALSTLLPAEFYTDIHLDDLTGALSGKDDPALFDSYIRGMSRLLNQAQADFLFFGERDWQKLAILRTLANDLCLPTEVVGVETERDMDGVPYSAAAASLDAKGRALAVKFSKELQAGAREISGGAPAKATIARIAAALEGAGAKVDYLEHLDAATLSAPTKNKASRLFGAIHIGEAGLIDDFPVQS